MPPVSRRRFIQCSTLVAGSLLLPADVTFAADDIKIPLHKKIGEGTTICPYCSCGCGLIIATDERGHIVNVEGDPENPINRGALDVKSISVRQLSNSELRLNKIQYRAPGATQWEKKSWDWAISQIAQRVQKARDATFVLTTRVGDKHVPVNRTEGIAWLGGAANNNEECYLAAKLMRSLGVVYLEHQARI